MWQKPKKKTSDKYIISSCDRLLYECLISRDKVCQRCGSYDNLVPSHCYGKKAWPSMRHILPNGLLLCNDCHSWWHANSAESWEWWIKEYKERYDYLVEIKNDYVKLNKRHYQDTAIELEIELRNLEEEK